MVKKITGKELKRKIDDGEKLVILEALPAQYYRKAHIPGALNIPHDQVDALAPGLVPDKSAQIVVYCADGPCENSSLAAKRLLEIGYKNVLDYHEGKKEWASLGYPLLKGSQPGGAQ